MTKQNNENKDFPEGRAKRYAQQAGELLPENLGTDILVIGSGMVHT